MRALFINSLHLTCFNKTLKNNKNFMKKELFVIVVNNIISL